MAAVDARSTRRTKRRSRTEIRLGLIDGRTKTPFRYEFLDPYYWLMEIRWPAFMATVVIWFIIINLIFAIAYASLPGSVANAQPGSLYDAFFFSVDTLATVGIRQHVSRLAHRSWRCCR